MTSSIDSARARETFAKGAGAAIAWLPLGGKESTTSLWHAIARIHIDPNNAILGVFGSITSFTVLYSTAEEDVCVYQSKNRLHHRLAPHYDYMLAGHNFSLGTFDEAPMVGEELQESVAPVSLEDLPYEILTGSILPLLTATDILNLGATCHYLHKVHLDEHFWRQRTFETFRLPPQPIRQKGWLDLFKRLSTARALTWGSNQFGRLGHSYAQTPTSLATIPTKINVPTPVDNLNEVVVDLGCGGWSTWALTSSGRVYGWGKVEGDEFWGTTKSTPYLVPFPQPIQRISVGRRNCLALADNGNLLTVDLDFQYPAIIKLTSPDIVSPDLPNGEHPVLHMSAGWRFAAAVIKGIGLMVWNSEVAGEDRRLIRRSNALLQRNRLLNRNFKARQVMRTEEVGVEPEQAGDLEIIGLMVGDGFLIYLTHGGTVHRVNIVYESIDSPDQPISFLLEEFAATPKLSYLSGSFFHFGLFNATGTVLVGSIDSMHTSNPQKPTGLQNRGVVALSWGDWHGLALCEDGSILTWGRELSGNGCLGLGYRDLDDAREMGLTISGTVINCLEPRRIAGYGGEEADYFAFGVAAGGWHSAALVANFKVQEQRKRDW